MSDVSGISRMGGPKQPESGVIRVGLADDQMLVRAVRMVVDSQDDMEVAWQVDDGAAAVEKVTGDSGTGGPGSLALTCPT